MNLNFHVTQLIEFYAMQDLIHPANQPTNDLLLILIQDKLPQTHCNKASQMIQYTIYEPLFPPDLYFTPPNESYYSQPIPKLKLNLIQKPMAYINPKPKRLLGQRIKHQPISPFLQAKQAAIKNDFKLWGSSFFFDQTQEAFQQKYKYISTCESQTKLDKFIVTTYLNPENIVVFRIKRILKPSRVTSIKNMYLTIYHQCMPNIDIVSMMHRWTDDEIYCFWLVRSYAVEAMLFRLKVQTIDPKVYKKFRYWQLITAQQIINTNQSIIKEFAQCGNWIKRKKGVDHRLAIHNQVDEYFQKYNWNLDGHFYLQMDEDKNHCYDKDGLERWYKALKRLYNKHFKSNRIRLVTHRTKHCRHKDIIIFTQNSVRFNFVEKLQMIKIQQEQPQPEPFIQASSWPSEQDQYDYFSDYETSSEKLTLQNETTAYIDDA